MQNAILAPAAVLIVWTLLVMMWMAFTRFGAVKQTPRDKLRDLPKIGGRGADLEAVLPQRANWPSHNYTHLLEQPTLFYATVIILALLGQTQSVNVMLAWAYVVLRIAHSLWQIAVNTISIRFLLFVLSSICLLILALAAVRAAVF